MLVSPVFDAGLAGVFGLLLGSFLNVVIHRLPLMLEKQWAAECAQLQGKPAEDGPVYCCQTDGMVGLGAGARSYTQGLHYSSSYAVERAATRDIVADFASHDAAGFRQAAYGFELDADEQRRRHVVQSLLTQPGLAHADYRRRFGTRALDDLPQLHELAALGLATDNGTLMALTERGVACSDSIGPWLVSPRVQRLMEGAAC